MRRKTALLAAVLAALLLPAPALAQTVSEGLIEVVGTLDLDALAAAAEDVPWLEGGVEQVITRLTADEALRWLMDEAAGVLRRSVWRITRLLVPALLVAAAELIAAPGKAAGKAARYAGLIMTMAFLVVDLREHVALAEESVGRMSEMMQAIFPLMVTLLAAVGGTASSAFYQPAVMAAAGGAHHGGESQRRASHIAAATPSAPGGGVDAGLWIHGVHRGDDGTGRKRGGGGWREYPHRQVRHG